MSYGSAIATGRTNRCRRTRHCSLAAARPYAHLPGGHQESWADAFCNVMRDVYAVIASGPPYRQLTPAVATFEDGYRANRIIEAILESAARGGIWTKVDE